MNRAVGLHEQEEGSAKGTENRKAVSLKENVS